MSDNDDVIDEGETFSDNEIELSDRLADTVTSKQTLIERSSENAMAASDLVPDRAQQAMADRYDGS